MSVRTATGPDRLTYLRMQITLAAFCTHRLRVGGSRIYVDLMPLEERAPSPLVPFGSTMKLAMDRFWTGTSGGNVKLKTSTSAASKPY